MCATRHVIFRLLSGILNSALLRTYWLSRFYDQRRTFPKIKGTYLGELPIKLAEIGKTLPLHDGALRDIYQKLRPLLELPSPTAQTRNRLPRQRGLRSLPSEKKRRRYRLVKSRGAGKCYASPHLCQLALQPSAPRRPAIGPAIEREEPPVDVL